MHSIREFMAHDHRHCDDVFAEAERLVALHDWPAASAVFAQFQSAVLQHFSAEESLLFPAFEAKTGMYTGPTQVMRSEHVQIRQLMVAASNALAAKDADDYAGYTETLLIMVQQHNLKEENVLYPMCDQALGADASTLLPQLQQAMPTQGVLTP